MNTTELKAKRGCLLADGGCVYLRIQPVETLNIHSNCQRKFSHVHKVNLKFRTTAYAGLFFQGWDFRLMTVRFWNVYHEFWMDPKGGWTPSVQSSWGPPVKTETSRISADLYCEGWTRKSWLQAGRQPAAATRRPQRQADLQRDLRGESIAGSALCPWIYFPDILYLWQIWVPAQLRCSVQH